VQQVLQRQQSFAQAQCQQFQKQVAGMNQLFEAQSLSLGQTNKQLQQVLEAIEPLLSSHPQLNEMAMKVQRSHAQSATLHQMLQTSLSKLQETEVRAQELQLKQSEEQLGGMYDMLQSQAVQLFQTQHQVSELQRFAQDAQRAVEQTSRVNNDRLQQTQEQVNDLQRQLVEQQQQRQQELRQQDERWQQQLDRQQKQQRQQEQQQLERQQQLHHRHQVEVEQRSTAESFMGAESVSDWLPEGRVTASTMSAERGTHAAMAFKQKQPAEIENRIDELAAELRGLLDLADGDAEETDDEFGFEEEWV